MLPSLAGILIGGMLHAQDLGDPAFAGPRYSFHPPACEFRVIFPAKPQQVGRLMSDARVTSAQLHIQSGFLRADCTPIPTHTPPLEWMLGRLHQQLIQLGGEHLAVTRIEHTTKSSFIDAMTLRGDRIYRLRIAYFMGQHSAMSLTAIDVDDQLLFSTGGRFIDSVATAQEYAP